MSKFRKKPVVVEANQLTEDNAHELALWCSGILHEVKFKPEFIVIQTFEGNMRAEMKDWIIKESFPTDDRKFYPCKPDIFEMTYEPEIDELHIY